MRYSDSKLKELASVIGEEVSENFSPTHRAKLVSINEFAGVCTMEVTESPYVSMVGMSTLNADKIGMRYEAPVYRIWNAFFF
jgi:hypothetical protein